MNGNGALVVGRSCSDGVLEHERMVEKILAIDLVGASLAQKEKVLELRSEAARRQLELLQPFAHAKRDEHMAELVDVGLDGLAQAAGVRRQAATLPARPWTREVRVERLDLGDEAEVADAQRGAVLAQVDRVELE